MHPSFLLGPILIFTSATVADNSAEGDSFKSAISAVAPALTSYAAAHTTDPGYESLKAYLSTQTAIPSASLSAAAAGEFFPDQQLVPTAVVAQLPSNLQIYASKYLQGFKEVATSAAGTDTFSFTFGGTDGAATSTTAPGPPATTSASAKGGTGSLIRTQEGLLLKLCGGVITVFIAIVLAV